MSVGKCQVVSNTFKPLKKIIKFACNRYFTSISTENNSSSFFSTSALKCISEVNKAYWSKLREEQYFFFHFSVKGLVNFSKNSKDTGTTKFP